MRVFALATLLASALALPAHGSVKWRDLAASDKHLYTFGASTLLFCHAFYSA